MIEITKYGTIRPRRPKRVFQDNDPILRNLKIKKIMETQEWKPILTEEVEHLCMEDTKWDTENPIVDYLTIEKYFRTENGEIIYEN